MPEPKKLSREQYLSGIYEALGGVKSQGFSLDDFKQRLVSSEDYVQSIYKGLGGENVIGDYDKFRRIVGNAPAAPAAPVAPAAPAMEVDRTAGFQPVDVKKKLSPLSEAYASDGLSTSFTDPASVSPTVRGFVTPVVPEQRLAELKANVEQGAVMQKELASTLDTKRTEVQRAYDDFLTDAKARGAVTEENGGFAFSSEEDLNKFKGLQASFQFVEDEVIRYNEINSELNQNISEYNSALYSQIYKEAEKSVPREAFDDQGNWASAGIYSLIKGTGDAAIGALQIVSEMALQSLIQGGHAEYISRNLAAGAGPKKDLEALSALEQGAMSSASSGFTEMREGVKNALRNQALFGNLSSGIPAGAIATPEYVDRLSRESWLGGAYVGAMQSVPAMLTPGMVGMAGQIYGFMSDEIENDPELAAIPNEHKMLLKSSTALVAGQLERFGFRNLISNKSIIKNIALSVIRKLPKGTPTKAALEAAIQSEARSFTANLGIRAATGFAAEYETGALQQLADITTKSIYDAAVGQDLFDNPTGIKEIAYEVNKAGVQEGMGAIIIGGRSMVVGALQDNILGDMMENGEFYTFEKALRTPKSFQAEMTAINDAIAAGKITEAEGAAQIGAMAKAQMVAEMMPSRSLNRYNQLESRRKIFDLLSRKLDLRNEIQKVDDTMRPSLEAEVQQINDQVRNIIEEMEAQVEEFGAAIPETTRGEQAPMFTASELETTSYTDILSKLYRAPSPEQRSAVRRMVEQAKGMARIAGPGTKVVMSPSQTARFGPSGVAMFFDAKSNTIFVNTAAYVDNVYAHEFSHPFVEFMMESDPEGFATVYNEVKDVEMPKGAVADLAKRFGLTEEQQASLADIKTYGQWADFIESEFPGQDAKVESIVEMMGDLFEARINANNAPSARRAVGRVFEYMGLNSLADKMYNIQAVSTNDAIAEVENQDFFSEASVQTISNAINRDAQESRTEVPSDVEAGQAPAPVRAEAPAGPAVEEQIADIERRRQEELKRFEGRRANSVVKYNPDGENTELTEDEIELVENLINKAKERGLSVDRTQRLLQANGFVQSVGNTATAFREFLKARLNGEIDNKVNGAFLNTINAKYDAELAALEASPGVETVSTQAGRGVQAPQAEVAPVAPTPAAPAAPAAPAPAAAPAPVTPAPAPVAPAPVAEAPKPKRERKAATPAEATGRSVVAANAGVRGKWNVVDKSTGDVLGTISQTGRGKKKQWTAIDSEGNTVGTAKGSKAAIGLFPNVGTIEFLERATATVATEKESAQEKKPSRQKPRETAKAPEKGERIVVYKKPIGKDRIIPEHTVMDNQTGDIMGTIIASVDGKPAKISSKNVLYTAKDESGTIVGTSSTIEGAARAITPYTVIEYKTTDSKPQATPYTPKAAPAPTKIVDDAAKQTSTAKDAVAAAAARTAKDETATLLERAAKLSLKDVIAAKAPKRRKVTERIEVKKDGKQWRVYEPQRLRRGTYMEDGTIRWYAFKNESDFTVDYVRNFPTGSRKSVADQLREKFDNVAEVTEQKAKPEVTAEQGEKQGPGDLVVAELLRNLGKRGKEVAVVVNPNTMTISEREPRRKVFVETKYTDRKKFNAAVKALQERINSGELDFQEEVKARMAALSLDLTETIQPILDEETDLLQREAEAAAKRAKKLQTEKAQIRLKNQTVSTEGKVPASVEEGVKGKALQFRLEQDSPASVALQGLALDIVDVDGDARKSLAVRQIIAFLEKNNNLQPGKIEEEFKAMEGEKGKAKLYDLYAYAITTYPKTAYDYLVMFDVMYKANVQMTPEQMATYNFFDFKQKEELKARMAVRYSPFVPDGLVDRVFNIIPNADISDNVSSVVMTDLSGGNLERNIVTASVMAARHIIGEELISITDENGTFEARISDLSSVRDLVNARIAEGLSQEEIEQLYDELEDLAVEEASGIASILSDTIKEVKTAFANEFNVLIGKYKSETGMSPFEGRAFTFDFLEYAYNSSQELDSGVFAKLQNDLGMDIQQAAHALFVSAVQDAMSAKIKIEPIKGVAPVSTLGAISKIAANNGMSPISQLARIVSLNPEDVEFATFDDAKQITKTMAAELKDADANDAEKLLAGIILNGAPDLRMELKGISPDDVFNGEAGLSRARVVKTSEAPRIGSKFRTIQDVAETFSFFRSTIQENSILVEVDPSGRLVDYRTITSKMYNTVSDAGARYELFNNLKSSNNKVFIIHNHPMDLPSPSEADVQSHMVNDDVLAQNFGGSIVLNGNKFSFIPPIGSETYNKIINDPNNPNIGVVPVIYSQYKPMDAGSAGVRLSQLLSGNVISAKAAPSAFDLVLPRALVEQVHILNSSPALSSNPGFTNVALLTVNKNLFNQEFVLKDVNFFYVPKGKDGKPSSEELTRMTAAIRRQTQSGIGMYTVAIMSQGSNQDVVDAVKTVASHMVFGNENTNEVVFAQSEKFVNKPTPVSGYEMQIPKRLIDELGGGKVTPQGILSELKLDAMYLNDENTNIELNGKEMNLTEFINDFVDKVYNRAGLDRPVTDVFTDLDIAQKPSAMSAEDILLGVAGKLPSSLSNMDVNGENVIGSVLSDFRGADINVSKNIRFSAYVPPNTPFSNKLDRVRQDQKRIVEGAKSPVARRFREAVLDKKVGVFNFLNKNINANNIAQAEILEAYIRTEGGKSIYASKMAEEKAREVFGKNVRLVSKAEMQEVEDTLTARSIIEVQDRRDVALAKQYQRKEDALKGATISQIRQDLDAARQERMDLRARIKRSERQLEAAIRVGDASKQAMVSSDIMQYTQMLTSVEAMVYDLAVRKKIVEGSAARIKDLEDPIKNPGGLTYEEAKQHLDQRKKDNPEMFAYANGVVDKMFTETKRQLKEKYDKGLISKSVYESLKDYGYSPRIVLQRLVDREIMAELGVLSQNPANGLKRLGLGTEDAMVTDPLTLFAATIISHERTLRRNELSSRLYDYVANTPNNGVISVEEPLRNKDGSVKRDRFGVIQYPPKIAPGTTVIDFYNKNNEIVRMRVDLEFFKTWRGLETWGAGTEASKIAFEALGVATGSTPLKLAATIANPAFAAVNIFRDFLFVNTFTNAFGNTLTGSMANYLKYASPLVVNRLFGDRSVSIAAEKGGYAMDFVSDSPLGYRNVSRTIATKRLGDRGNKAALGLSYIQEGMLFLQEKSEKLTRLAIFDKAYRDLKAQNPNMSEDELLTMAAAKARQHMDYAISGQASYMVEKFMPYTNAATRAIETSIYYMSPLAGDKLFGSRLSKDPKMVNAWSLLKIAEFAVGYASIMAFNNFIGEPDEEFDKNGEKRPHALDYFAPQIKDRNIVVLTGKWKDKTTGDYVTGWSRNAVPEAYTFGIPYEAAPFVRLTQAIADSVNPIFSDRHDIDGDSNLHSALELGAEYYIPLLGPSIAKSIQNKSVVDAFTGMVGQVPSVASYIAYNANYDTYMGDEIFREGFAEMADTDKYDDRTHATFVSLGQAINAKPKQLQAAFEKIATKIDNQYFLRLAFSATDNLTYEGLIEDGVVQGTVKPPEAAGEILKSGGGLTKRVVRDGNLGWRSAKRYDSLDKSSKEEADRARLRRDIKAIVARWDADSATENIKEALDRIKKTYDIDNQYDEAERMGDYYYKELARTTMLSPQALVVVSANTPSKRAEILTQIFEKDGREAVIKTLNQIRAYEVKTGESIISDKTVEKFIEYGDN